MNDTQQRFFRGFDKARLGEVAPGHVKKRDELIEILDWKKGDGLCPLHFRDKPAGSQCTWSVVWNTAGGPLVPNDYFDVEHMTAIELLVEAQDLVHQETHLAEIRCPDPRWVKREIAPIVQAYEDGEIPDLHSLKNKLRQIREHYAEFIAPWAPIEDPIWVIRRNGWSYREEDYKVKEAA